MPQEGRRLHVNRCSGEKPPVPRDGNTVETKLLRIAGKARRESRLKFNNLFHLMERKFLRECFGRLSKDAVSGIDRMTKEMYASKINITVTRKDDMPVPFKEDPKEFRGRKLFAHNVFDLLPKDDDCFIYEDIFSQLDTSALEEKYNMLGQHVYHPKLIVSILIYAYSQGVYSSRKINF